MRNAFLRTLMALAEGDDRVELVVGDLGWNVFEGFAERFPSRYTNAGVAEQNMMGLAAGLALSGSTVFTYSIANFPTLRCLEQVRNDVCYHGANVKIVAVGGGLAYGSLGFSHHAVQDLAVLRSLPGLMIAAPGDPLEVEAVTRVMAATDGPAYLRLGKAGEPEVHDRVPSLPLGSSVEVRGGSDVAIFSIGAMLPMVVAAAEKLDADGVSTRVVSVPWLWPLDEEAIARAGAETDLVVTVEEHSVVGGLGGAVADVLAARDRHAPLVRLGVPHSFLSAVGNQDYLRQLCGLDVESIVERVHAALGDR